MCASCGCGMVNGDHGDPRHITLNDLEAAAEAAGITVEDVMRNLEDASLTRGEEGADRESARAGSQGRNRA